MTIEILEQEEVCGTCKYFYQHYAPDKMGRRGWVAVNFGHCIKPRVKVRQPGDTACKHWERNEGQALEGLE